MRNLPPDAIAGQASYISGSHKPLYMMQGLDASFDAVLFVSYHGSVGASAGLSHTYNPRAVVEARINDVVTGEAGINALVAAHYGVPVVLVTGDRCACEETAALIPGVHAAVVKEHVSRLAAHSLHPSRACKLIRETAQKAVSGAAAAEPAAVHHPGAAGCLGPHHRHRRGGHLGARRAAGRRRGNCASKAMTCWPSTARSARRSC